MKASVDLILREIERSDNEKMRYKKDIMAQFITERFKELNLETDIIKAYDEYEKELLDKEIKDFAANNGIDEAIIKDTVAQYFANEKSVTKEGLRQQLSILEIGLLKMTKLIKGILAFTKDMYNKFTAEGE